MVRLLLIFLFVFLFFGSITAKNRITEKEKIQIVSILDKQVTAWNEGNLKKFMGTYWRSEDLVFIGSRGPTYGWQSTLDNYKKGYPSKAEMGQLELKLLDISKIDKKTVFLIGRFELTREIGDVAGHFSLLLQKRDKKWVIISDHSSAD